MLAVLNEQDNPPTTIALIDLRFQIFPRMKRLPKLPRARMLAFDECDSFSASCNFDTPCCLAARVKEPGCFTAF